MRLFGDWYLVRDTGIPNDYPPRAQEELVRGRLGVHDDLVKELSRREIRMYVRRGLNDGDPED